MRFKNKKAAVVLLLFGLLIIGCNSNKNLLLKQRPIAPNTFVNIQVSSDNDSLFVNVKNTVGYDVLFYSNDSLFNSYLKAYNYSNLEGFGMKNMRFSKEDFLGLKYTCLDFNKPYKEIPSFYLPLKKDKPVAVLQANNGKFTHFKLDNKYALDFKLNVGDTIYSSADGIVFAVREESNRGGNSSDFLNWDNYIFLYHPELNLMSAYVHLDFKGSLVVPGQKIKAKQPIGIVGLTGYTTEPHLHFHVVKLNQDYMFESIPYKFYSGYESLKLKKGDVVIRK